MLLKRCYKLSFNSVCRITKTTLWVGYNCGSSCLRRLQARDGVWPWKQWSLHKSIDPTGIWACHHFSGLEWKMMSWPAKLLKAFIPPKMLLKAHRDRAHESEGQRCAQIGTFVGDNTGRVSLSCSSDTNVPSLSCSQALQGNSLLIA